MDRMGSSRRCSRVESLNRRAAFTPLQWAKVSQHGKLKRRERRAPTARFVGPAGVTCSSMYLRVQGKKSHPVNPVFLRFAPLRRGGIFLGGSRLTGCIPQPERMSASSQARTRLPQAITLLVVSTRPATPFASWTAPAERGGDGAFARTRGPQASAVRRPHESGVALPAAVHDVPRNFDVPGNSVRVMDCAGKAPAATALSDARGSCELLSTVARTEARWRNKKFLRADAEGANRPYQGSTVAH